MVSSVTLFVFSKLSSKFKQNLSILRKNRDILVNGLNLLKGISCIIPDGAFYAFPNIKISGLTFS